MTDHDPMRAHLESYARLPDDWDSYGSPPPSHEVVALALTVYDGLRRNGPDPQRVAPIPGPGVIIWTEQGSIEVMPREDEEPS